MYPAINSPGTFTDARVRARKYHGTISRLNANEIMSSPRVDLQNAAIFTARESPSIPENASHNRRVVNTNERFSLSFSLSFFLCCRACSRFRRFISAVLRLAQSRDRGITHLRSVAFAAIKLSLYAASFILGELYPLEGWRIYSRCYARRRYFRREAARHLDRTVRRLWRKLEPMFLSTWYFVCVCVCVPVNTTGRYCTYVVM